MYKKKIKEYIDRFDKLKILIIGDVMVDTYMWGEVNRISPEAPVPVVSCHKEENRLGGAANVALNVKALAAEPLLCAVTGDDSNAKVFNSLLNDAGISTEFILKDPARPTSNKTRIIGHTQHLLRVDQESTEFIDDKIQAKMLARIEPLISQRKVDAVIFQDYDKGVLTKNIIKKVTDLANKYGIPTLVDPKKRSFLLYENTTLFKPNFKEFTDGLNVIVKKDNFEQIFELAKKFLLNQNNKYIFITLSEMGVFITDGKSYANIPSHKREIADVSGAGDTVIATVAVCLASGLSMDMVAEIANLAGGLVCEKVGVVPIKKEDLLQNL